LFVFDEIDTGTSGQATKTIAQQLQKLAVIAKQVVAISHQPIVAAAATTCLEVEKTSKPDLENPTQWRSHSQVRVLSQPADRLPIISRLAGGENGQTEASITFAQELLTEMQASPVLV
jgi:DNA repair ATPase RecN